MSYPCRVALLVVIVACGSGSGGDRPADDAAPGDGAPADAGPPPDAAIAPYCAPRGGAALRLAPVAEGLARPVAVAAPPADPRLFVVEQPGRIRVVAGGELRAAPFLSIEVNDLGTEQGLLGLAFHPRYAANGRFFVFYVRPGSNDLRIAEYRADPAADVAEPDERVLLDIPHPTAGNHNGGTLAFGPDGLLYASVGDGGGANDFFGNGQDPHSLKAKLLRIDVDAGGDAPYGIPPDNPWASGGGAPEAYAWGLRNPWRFAIDRATGDVWIGDVGQSRWEELDVVRAGDAGANLGWPVFEGPDCFDEDEEGRAGCDDPAPYTAPVLAYDRRGTGQCSIVAGVVYRGGCMPDLDGRVLFGDYCSGQVWSVPADARAATLDDAVEHTGDLDPDGLLYGRLAAFGVDGWDEPYVTSLQGGAVYRIELE